MVWAENPIWYETDAVGHANRTKSFHSSPRMCMISFAAIFKAKVFPAPGIPIKKGKVD